MVMTPSRILKNMISYNCQYSSEGQCASLCKHSWQSVISLLRYGDFSIFTAWRSYASAVLRVVILSVCLSVRLSHACFVT